MKPHLALASLAAAPLLVLATPASAAGDRTTGAEMLRRLTDPAAATAPLPPAARVVQRSSHEREGGNRDWGVWSETSGRPVTFVRREAGGVVLLDEQRPGCLSRIWFTAGAFTGNITGAGRLQLFFDGERSPRVDVPAVDFFAGRVPGFPQPLVGDANSSSGGFYSYVPFCFARSLKVRVTQVPEDEQLWYQLTALTLPHGAAVETYRPGSLPTDEAAAALRDAGEPPRLENTTTEATLLPGDVATLAERAGAGSIRHLRIGVTPFTAETLGSLEVRITADGAKAPQLAVPLGVLFGDGLSVRAIRSLAFGMDPTASTGYFSLPVPYRDGVTVSLAARQPSAELAARTPVSLRATTWWGRPMPDAGVLHGRRTVEVSRRGRDFTALRATGSGRLAAWVLDLRGAPGSNLGPLQFMLEGDERVHVDDSPSPSIYGTGLEDAFNSGFYYNRGPISLPTHGAGLFRADGTRAARSQYRVFGTDGVRWENGVRFGMEHGGGDEKDGQITASTAFWYTQPAALRRTDLLLPADADSARTHRLRGPVEARRLTSYFEGEHDGNLPDSTEPMFFGGTAYPAPPPDDSPEGVTADGVAFTHPLSFTLHVGRENCGVILRRLLDAATQSRVDVSVDGEHVGPWQVTEANRAKRWRADDFPLHPTHTSGKQTIRITLTPSGTAAATAFRIEAYARTHPGCRN